MMDDRARQEYMVTVTDVFVDENRRKAARRAEILEIRRHIAVAVIHAETRSDLLPDTFRHLFFRHEAMRTE